LKIEAATRGITIKELVSKLLEKQQRGK